MDRLIWIAWRAFWVSVGACAVLVAQSLAVPPGDASEPARELPPAAPAVPAAPAARVAPVSAAVGLPTGAGKGTVRASGTLPIHRAASCLGTEGLAGLGRSC